MANLQDVFEIASGKLFELRHVRGKFANSVSSERRHLPVSKVQLVDEVRNQGVVRVYLPVI